MTIAAGIRIFTYLHPSRPARLRGAVGVNEENFTSVFNSSNTEVIFKPNSDGSGFTSFAPNSSYISFSLFNPGESLIIGAKQSITVPYASSTSINALAAQQLLKPSAVIASYSSRGTASLSWAAPLSQVAPQSYTIEYSRDGVGWLGSTTVASTVLSHSFTSLGSGLIITRIKSNNPTSEWVVNTVLVEQGAALTFANSLIAAGLNTPVNADGITFTSLSGNRVGYTAQTTGGAIPNVLHVFINSVSDPNLIAQICFLSRYTNQRFSMRLVAGAHPLITSDREFDNDSMYFLDGYNLVLTV